MPARIGPVWALLIGFVALMASNSWFKGIFGVGEIATNVPFLLTGLVLFAIWRDPDLRGQRPCHRRHPLAHDWRHHHRI